HALVRREQELHGRAVNSLIAHPVDEMDDDRSADERPRGSQITGVCEEFEHSLITPKSEIRMSKSKTNPNHEFRKAAIVSGSFLLRISTFLRISRFVFRIFLSRFSPTP